jgi:hypothetical protein
METVKEWGGTKREVELEHNALVHNPIFKNSVRTAKKTPHFTVTKIN